MARGNKLFGSSDIARRPAALLGLAVAVAVGAWYFMATFGAGGRPYADPADPDMVRLGKTVYMEHCARCHGPDLEGEPNWRRRHPDGTLPAPPHDESGHTWHHPDSLLFTIIREGGQAVAPTGFRSAMPAYSGILSDREILASLAYIKSRWPDGIQQRQELLNRQAN